MPERWGTWHWPAPTGGFERGWIGSAANRCCARIRHCFARIQLRFARLRRRRIESAAGGWFARVRRWFARVRRWFARVRRCFPFVPVVLLCVFPFTPVVLQYVQNEIHTMLACLWLKQPGPNDSLRRVSCKTRFLSTKKPAGRFLSTKKPAGRFLKACSHCKLDWNWFETGLAECAFNPHWCELVAFTLQFYPSGIHTLINTYSHPRLQVSCDCHAR